MSRKYNIDPLAPFEEKQTNAFGLAVAELIATDWFKGSIPTDTMVCEFNTRRDWIRNKRLFARGEVDVSKFKKRLSKTDSDLKYLNLDFRYINVAEKFGRIVINGISDENYLLDIRSTDKISVRLKKEKEQEYRKYIASSKLLEATKRDFGIDLAEGKQIPSDEEEMNMWLETKDRPKIEIAEESLIEWIKETNGWDDIEAQKNKDLVEAGIAVGRVWIDKNDGVKVSYVDPENYVHSHVKSNDFKEKFYEGVVEVISIADVQRESNLDDDSLRKIAKCYATINKISHDFNWDSSPVEDILTHRVHVLRYAYKTSKRIKYKKKIRNGETVKISKRSDTYTAPNRSDVGELDAVFDTWIEGNFILGSQIVYGWKECENLYDDIMNRALSPFITYATDIRNNRLRSFYDNIEKISDEMNFIALKIQHLTSELKPDLTVINEDALAELGDSEGGSKTTAWQDAIDLIGARGLVIEKTIDLGDAGGQQRVTAAKPYALQQGSGITVLLNQWAHYYNMIRENTGINPARDGMMGQDALVGINQMAQLASNTVTKNIADTSVRFNKKICEVISTRIHMIYRYSEAHKLRELYTNVVGKHLFDNMEIMKNRHLHEFGFTFRMVPTNEVVQKFREDLSIALQTSQITIDIKMEAESMFKTNPKLATQFLSYSVRKIAKQRMEEQKELAQHKSMSDAQAAQAKAQADAQALEFKAQVDLKVYGQKARIDIDKQIALNDINTPVNERKFQHEAQMEAIKTNSKFNMEDYKEERKDNRTKLQATQQSKMIDQRNFNKQPIDFENQFNFTENNI